MNKVYAILLWFALLFCHNGLLAQNGGVIVTGKVYAEDEPEGFIGATVIEQDKNGRIYSSALTDFNGNFSLKIKNPNNSLNFSFVGYKKLTVSIGNKRKFDVKLESQNVMKEVTVKASKLVGGGGLAIPEREYSGAMQKFNTKAIEGVSVASIDDALQGRIAGLDIVANSGDLGSGSVMRIRGITSINSNSQPLILLNGIPFESNIDASFDFASADQEQFASLLCISPDDIEEITVLKDGAAAAIWGSRGANGVIDITTKKGVTGPTRVSYSYRFSGSGHHIEIMAKSKSVDEALFYINEVIAGNWSRATLMNMQKAGLYERRGRAQTNFNNKLPQPQDELAQEILKDPYNFDFLTLREPYNEHMLEEALEHNIRRFLLCIQTTYDALNDFALLESAVREDLNSRATRVSAVINPVKLIITNYPEGQVEEMEAVNNPEDPSAGTHTIEFSRELWIERDDFMEDAPKKYFRMTPGQEVRLKSGYIVKCTGCKKDDNGNVVEVYCEYDPDSKTGMPGSNRKIKGTIHWVSCAHCLPAEVRLYDRLWKVENPRDEMAAIREAKNCDALEAMKEMINPNSLNVLTNCYVEKYLADAKPLDYLQFQRIGYFNVDKDSTPEHLVFNRTVSLKDTWSKINK